MFDRIIKFTSTTPWDSSATVTGVVAAETPYIVEYTFPSGVPTVTLVPYTVVSGSTVTAGTPLSTQMSATDWEALTAGSDYVDLGGYIQYYNLTATTHGSVWGISTDGKYVIESEPFGQLVSTDLFAYAPNEKGPNAPADFIVLNPDFSVKVADGIGTADGSNGGPTKTNADVMAAMSTATVKNVYIVDKYDDTVIDPVNAFTFVGLVDISTDITGLNSLSVEQVSLSSSSPSTPTSGDVFSFDVSGGVLYGLTTTGNYLIVKNSSNDYSAYAVTGTGTSGDPYVITPPAITLTLSDSDYAAATGANPSITGLTFVANISPSGSGGSGSGSGSGGDAAYAGASGEGTISGAPDLTGKTIYSIDASTLTETGSLSGLLVDGLYVFDGSDVSGGSGGWDAYRLGGNAQQGWNVVEKVTGAYSASTIYSSEPAVGTLGARIVEISGATYDVYTLTSANNSVDGNFAVVEVSAGTFKAYAVTGAGTPESPFVMGAENTSATGLDAVTSSIGQVFEFAADDGSNLDGKNVALIGNDTNGWDAFEAHGGDGSAFALGDKVADDLFALESDITTQSFDVVGYLETATSVSYAGGASDELLFEIQRVAGERYGNIVTYGVKLVDGEIGETVTFDSLTFNVKWENDANGADYSFWGQFKPAAHAPAVGTNTSGSGNPVTFFNEGDGTGITFGMYADTGIKFDEGEYIATFMLEKTNTDDENSLYLNTAQYTLYDATDMGSIKSPETPHYGTQADDEGGNASLTYFDFGYANHTIGLNLEADNGGSAGAGQDLADVELLVTDIAKGEGLSLVPIAKNGNLIQYQVVMNVPIPIFIQADTDTSVDIDPDYKIVITGADIFDESVSWLTDLADGGSQTEALVAGTSVFIDGAAATATQKATTSTYTGHNFYDTIVQALDPLDMRSDLSDLATSNSLTLEIKGLNLPDVSSTNAEGRYVLAEFTAISGATTAITYQSSQGDGSYGSASSHVISRIANADGALAGASSPWDNPISDGSEITAMAESIYTNEQAYNDAIGAEDALGALRISRDTAATAAENRYSQAQIIAADFNMDGRVSSADAYDILHYAVHGHESNGPTAQWVFVDDIANNKATPKNVKFDNVIDLFVGESFDINATAVLLGDVSQSYSGPPTSDPTWTDTAVTALEALSGLGIADMALQFAAANGTATGTAGRDLIYVGTTGAYDISNYQSAVTSSLMSGDIIALNGAFPTLSFATYTSTALNYDSSASGTPPSLSEILAAADAVVDNSSNAVKIEIVDNASNGANPTSYVLAIDMSGDGTLSATDDLIITTVGSAAHYVSNPLNPEIFTLSEFTA